MTLNHKAVVSFAVVVLMLAASILSLASIAPQARALTLYSDDNPTPAEQLVLQYINRARANPVAEGQRLGIDIHEGLQDDPSNGCYGPEDVMQRPPLTMNPILLSIARAHSQDMNDRNYFDHTDPNGTTAFQRMTNAGYEFTSAGENIATGVDMTAVQLEDELMLDPGYPCRGHRMNLLDIFPSPTPAYLEVGVGYYQGSSGQVFLTQDFGTANAGPFLTGVVYSNADGSGFYAIGEGISGVTITPSAGDYYAISSSSGGYAFPIPTSGTMTVTASGAGFGPISQTIALTGQNIELDFTPHGSSGTTTTQSTTQSTTQATTQSTSQITTQSTTQTQTTVTQLYQSGTQTSTSTTSTSLQQLLEQVTFQSSPSNFLSTTTPATITACGETSSYFTGLACGTSFGATANLPAPATGWVFDHWTWAGGVACASSSANPATCSAYNSGGVLIAVYAAQLTVLTNPVSSATVSWGSCSAPGVSSGEAFFSDGFGSSQVSACNLPAGYSFSSWTCTGGVTCQSYSNPTTLTFTGPGRITLNLQAQTSNNTSTTTIAQQATSITTQSSTTTASIYTPGSIVTSTVSTSQASLPAQLTSTPIPGFPLDSILAGFVLGMVALAMLRRRRR